MFDRRSPHATQMGVGVKENQEGLEGATTGLIEPDREVSFQSLDSIHPIAMAPSLGSSFECSMRE